MAKVYFGVHAHQADVDEIIVVLKHIPRSIHAKEQVLGVKMPWDEALAEFPMGKVFVLAPHDSDEYEDHR
jgi:hypothetical protein